MKSMTLLLAIVVMLVTPQIGVTIVGGSVPFSTLALDWAKSWGNWGKEEFCPVGTFAYAFRIKVDPPRGGDDDTSMNGIELLCRPVDNCKTQVSAEGLHISSTVGKWGQWRAWKSCKHGLLTGLRMKSEKHQGSGDDTAANNLEMQCKHSRTVLNGGGNRWGHYSSWAVCPSGSAICGLTTLVEPVISGDNTGLNNVRMFCCELQQ